MLLNLIFLFNCIHLYRYNSSRLGILFDPLTNLSHTADPSNSSFIMETFLDDHLMMKWKSCCQAAVECCVKMATDPAPTAGETFIIYETPNRIRNIVIDKLL